ncbi:DUF488 family protein [Myxococcus sp. RHSTA-1-4]|uniref:DUF488 family protein, N3 subclade n=1 Tax=Myxococcus sp. RHSTA-1-4 TaxID=2874601 RepID=UPI001CBDA250|nr:DUF488 family protein [Myxococcus sp. RHSTA-1-4]MBZ4422773.1 DUF488 domain-containing protein [Myxococcus sp. RHSTA-1-4]
MLKRASLAEVTNGTISRAPGQRHLVVAMQLYPRFLSKAKIDEYLRCLSPEANLFAEYRKLCVQYDDHEKAFENVRYEERFDLSDEGKENLARLAELSESQDVILICRCDRGQHCHVDLVLLMARAWFGASISELPFEYRRFQERFAR